MTGIDGGAQILPFYIVCDESFSMSDRIDDVNTSLVELHKAVASDAVVCDKAQIGVITFSDSAEVLVELTRPDDLTSMPGCTAKGGTNYGAAFQKLRSTIDADVARLKASGLQVLRPVAFFITDGEPTDGGWETHYDNLTSPNNPYRPHILSFGVDKADPSVILHIATAIDRMNGKKFAYLAENGTAPGPALKEIISKLASTIVNSGRSSSPQLVPPTNIPGVISLDVI